MIVRATYNPIFIDENGEIITEAKLSKTQKRWRNKRIRRIAAGVGLGAAAAGIGIAIGRRVKNKENGTYEKDKERKPIEDDGTIKSKVEKAGRAAYDKGDKLIDKAADSVIAGKGSYKDSGESAKKTGKHIGSYIDSLFSGDSSKRKREWANTKKAASDTFSGIKSGIGKSYDKLKEKDIDY